MGTIMASRQKKQRTAKAIEAIITDDPYFPFTHEDTKISLEANNWTLLHLAVWLNKPVTLKKLLELKPNLDVIDSNSETPMQLALITQNDNIYRILKEAGANDSKKGIPNETIAEIDLLGDQTKKIEFQATGTGKTPKSLVLTKNGFFSVESEGVN
ncbi:unnamed protein product [Blepharisma stoltei]|uniref:Ankyrin repeat domain-containing protein n=1 Tax=Blepharisma stoltei TaxID=1481888 RepID=A0AAU9JE88_9CILI|nr:unnamed protein product [Blepharisma stoltei]